MRAVDIIEKKRDGIELSRQEIEYFVRGYTNGEIPDYQAAAWAMAVLLKGMTAEETTFLTLAMANSGEKLDLNTWLILPSISIRLVVLATNFGVVVPLVRAWVAGVRCPVMVWVSAEAHWTSSNRYPGSEQT